MNRARITIWSAASAHLLFFLLSYQQVEPFHTNFYSLAWWTYILAIAGVNHLKGQNSVVFDSATNFLQLVVYSSLVWFFFEACNFRLRNWGYFAVPDQGFLRYPGYFIAFGTVLPGLIETQRLLCNLDFPQPLQGKPIRVSWGLQLGLPAIGLLTTAAWLMRPQFFFPLVWIGLVFILDPILYRFGGRRDSFLARVDKGEYTSLVRWSAAGMICGVLWEFWNFWSGAHWKYFIPYFDFWRVFQMPLLGYFGFPFFALQAFLFYRAFLLFRDKVLRRFPVLWPLVVVLAAFYSLVIIRGIEEKTIRTFL